MGFLVEQRGAIPTWVLNIGQRYRAQTFTVPENAIKFIGINFQEKLEIFSFGYVIDIGE